MSDIMNYKACEAFYNGRAKRNDYRNMKDKTKVTFHGDHYLLTYFNVCRIEVYPDDRIRIHIPFWGQAAVMKVYKLTGVCMSSYKSAYPLYKNHCRIADSNAPDGRSYPYVDGAWYKDGRVMEPEKHVDHKRSIDPAKRLEIQRRLRPLSKLARVLAVLDVYETKPRNYWERGVPNYDQAIALFDYDGATNQLAEIVCGPSVAHEKTRYYYAKGDMKAHRLRAVKYGMAKFTEELYEHHNAYVWNEVKP